MKQSNPICYLLKEKQNVYECHWTDAWVKEQDVIWSGAIMPNVKFKYACTPGYEAERKKEVNYFNEIEANCNTCKHLRRVPHEKCKSGFLYGKCKESKGEIMQFHPDDPMYMPCYEPR